MTRRIAFSVPGTPLAKGRPRASGRVVDVDGQPTAIVSMHTPKKTVQGEKAILTAYKAVARGAQPLTGPVRVNIVAVFAIPVSWPKALQQDARAGKIWHVGRPDLDNLQKAALDALNGHAWIDDGQVAILTCGKRYGAPERIDVTVEAIDQADVSITPGQRRTEKRIADGPDLSRAKPVRKPGNGRTGKRDPKLQAAIDAAIARDAAAQRKLL